jgi:hypothetical protein
VLIHLVIYKAYARDVMGSRVIVLTYTLQPYNGIDEVLEIKMSQTSSFKHMGLWSISLRNCIALERWQES